MALREPAPELREQRRLSIGASWTVADWVRSLSISVAAGLFLSFAGAFGTGGAPAGVRLAYWIGVMILGTAVSRAVYAVIGKVPLLRDHRAAELVVGALAMSLLYTALVWAISTRLLGAGSFSSPVAYFIPVLVVSVAMTALNVLAARKPVETHAAAPGAPAPRFLERMPPKLRGATLQAVEAQDHYLRLHTDRGSDLILMRLADAVAELDGLEGAQTHRSWWVARDAVASGRREGGRAVLTLKSGAEAPVSRSYVRALKDEGWFS